MTVFEVIFLECRNRQAHVLFLAAGIGESEVDEADFVFLDQLHDFFRIHIHSW